MKEEASSSDTRIDMLAKTLERMMDRLDNIERRPQWIINNKSEIPILEKTQILEKQKKQPQTKQ